MIPDTARLFQELVEHSPDAQVLVGPAGQILYANLHAHSIFGYEPHSLPGVPVEELVPQEQFTAHQPEPRQPEIFETRFLARRRNGTEFPADVRLAPVRTGQSPLTLAVIRDASASERLRSALESARRQAEEANEAKSRFLAAASHDLRQPMQALNLIHGALARRAAGVGVAELLEEQGSALEGMSQLLNALLNVAKLESGTLHAEIAATSLRKIFDDLRRQFSKVAAAKAVVFDIDAPDSFAMTDRTLLHELLQNLLANAFRYTDSGRVCLRCIPGPERIRIEVEDSGIGIPESLQKKIFDDFYQVEARGDEHRGGAGLGLGIVRRVAQLLDASVHVTSCVGVGTKFTVEVRACSSTPHERAAPAPPVPRTTHRRILIVEDEAPLRTVLKSYLKLDNHEVLSVGSLAELDVLLGQLEVSPELLITDYQLGQTDRGSEAVERVRQRFGHELPTIVLTGDTSAVPSRVFGQGRTRLLNKPVDGRVLAAAVNELLTLPP